MMPRFHGAGIPWEHPELHAMGHSKSRLLLLIGSGPGLGRSVALYFAQQYFNRVALIARTAEQLQKNRITVEGAAAAVGRKVIVQTWQLDVCDIELLGAALKEINQFGNLECVYYNAARVGLSPLFTAATETIEADWRVTNRALYVTARWAMPILLDKSRALSDWKPSFLVTSSFLPVEPIPELFSLSMAKAAQANMVKSLQKTYTCLGIHVGLVVVGGVMSADVFLTPAVVAEQAWLLFAQKPEDWTTQVTIREDRSVDWTDTI